MKKLKLNLENLRVDSFETARDATGMTGTVRANGETYPCTQPITCVRVEPTGGACQSMQNCGGSVFTVCACSVTSCTTDLIEH
ncbi:pinensin family lanthipeptide [Longimicrobium terrae]|uniref:Uncharacterized protein n=1 Tax=Longimicrobium terrae TaxID=1639882 RepID=A0A841GRN0_9BACT|nr:pinensin family lanthipeptide [Longimicrobium terrae]MBB4635416.1 hypothetical protein [Longimicrobium terrae]MBB6069810.1 hypothetical protein [Longimicrobium terrae]NNC30981.1 hypothetical protein [Longimicrobium terrae]